MHFAYHQPTGALAGFVKTIWTASGTQEEFASPEPIVPDGCVELVFNLADPFRNGEVQPLALLAGQMMAPVVALPTGAVDLIGVRFHAGRAGAALRIPMWELQDRIVDASAAIAGADRLVDELRSAASSRRLACLHRGLPAKFGSHDLDTSRLTPVDHAIELIQSGRGAVSIHEVARQVGLTRRHLERRFLDEVGLTMKDLARLARIHTALRHIESPREMSGAAIAAACGFSDQAHLIRECRELTGQTPGRFRSGDSLGGLMREAPGK